MKRCERDRNRTSHKRTKKPLHGAKADEEKLFRLSSFPSLNPSPIIEVDSAGAITYLNPAAERRFPDMEAAGSEHPMLKGLQQVMVELQSGEQESVTREVEVGNEVYEQHISYVSDGNLMRIYTLDVTERKRLGHEVESHYQELQILHEISQAILSSPDLETILERILDKALQIGPFDIGIIRLLEPSGKILKPVAIRGYQDPRNVTEKSTASGDPTAGLILVRVMAEKEAYVVENVSECDGLRSFKREGVQSAVVVSVRAQEQVLGTIELGSRSARKFQPRQVRLLEAIGSHMGVAVQKARLYEQADRSRRHAEALREIGLSLTATHDPQQVLERIAEEARQLIGALFTFVVTPDTPFYRFAAVAGDDKGYREVLKLSDDPASPYGQGPLGQAIRSRKPVICEDVLVDPLFVPWREMASARGIRSLVAVPLLVQEKPAGALLTYAPIPQAYDVETMSLLSSLAAQAAAALENARLFQETERRAQEQSVFNTIAKAISQSLEVEQLLRIALGSVLTAMGREVGYVRLLDEGQGTLHLVAHLGLSEDFIRPYRTDRPPLGKAGKVLASGTPLVLNDMQAEEIRRDTRAQGIVAMAFIPLMAKGKALGLLNLATRRQQPFEAREVDFLSSIGEVIGVALDNARLFEEVRRKSQQFEALVKINRDVAALLDREILLPRIAEEARKILKVDSSIFRLIEGKHLVVRSASDPEKLNLRPKLRLDESVSGRIVQENRSIAIKNVFKDTTVIEEHREVYRKAGYHSFLGVPLSVGNRVIGTLNFYSKEEREFRPEEISIITSFADQAAIAIENANFYHESRRQEEIQKLLKELSQDITSLDIHNLLQKLTEKVREFFDVEISDARIIEKGLYRFIVASGIEPERIRGRGTNRGRSKWILENRRAIVIADIAKETDLPTGESIARLGIHGYLAVPLFSRGGEVVGVMRALTYQPRDFTQREIDLMQQLANGAAIAIENARLFDETERRAQEQEALNAIARATSQSLRLDELLQISLDKVLEVTGRERSYIRLKDPETGEITLAAHRGISEEYAETLLHKRTPGGKSDQVFESGEPLIINDPEGILLKEETR
ncbi:MAG: GAF domain-containing protein, partial [Deltaproteobacteria bacterium]|nr:GAF domain-containing protein [Deltaproteobacteria bacterium]